MNRQEFVEKYRHVIGGMILDAYTARQSGESLSIRLRLTMDQVDRMLGAAYEAAQPKPEAATNGKLTTPTSNSRS